MNQCLISPLAIRDLDSNEAVTIIANVDIIAINMN